jgi:hypothetical protein
MKEISRYRVSAYLNHENTRHYGFVWEMPLEEFVVYCDILNCNSIFSCLVLTLVENRASVPVRIGLQSRLRNRD